MDAEGGTTAGRFGCFTFTENFLKMVVGTDNVQLFTALRESRGILDKVEHCACQTKMTTRSVVYWMV